MARARANHEDVTDVLEAAAASARAGEWEAVATGLVAAWRRAPSQRIAKLLAVVDKNLPPPTALRGTGVLERERNWQDLAASRDDAYLATLLAEAWPVHPRAAKARVEALAAWPRSPRISTALLELLSRGQYRSRAGRLVTRKIYTLLLDRGDPAVGARLGELADEQGVAAEAERASMPAIMKRRRADEPAWELREATALASIEALVVPEDSNHAKITAELLAAIYAAPHDDAPRLVLADHLIERGDPRGELIALQIQRTAHRRRGGLAHERALIRRGGSAWWDGLDDDGAFNIEFGRGFPISCATRGTAFRVPAWATIETLTLWRRDVPFTAGPMLRGLRELRGVRVLELGGIHHLERELDTLQLLDGIGRPLDMQTCVAPLRIAFVDNQLTSWRAQMREVAARIHAWPLGRRLATIQLETTGALDLALAFELLEVAPRLGEVILARHEAAVVRVRWTARVNRAELALEWHDGGGGPPFESIVDVVRKLVPRPIEVVTASGTRGVDPAMVDRVRTQLERNFASWPNVRTLQLFTAGSRPPS